MRNQENLYKSRFQEVALLSDYALFVFYLERVAEEQVSPSGLFSEEDYRAAHPDIAAAIAAGRLGSGFDYFAGQDEPVTAGTLPHFDADQPNHAGAIRAERDFVLSGQPEIGARLWWFDECFYLTVYPDVHALKRQGAIRSGLEHFMMLGGREGWLPHPALMALAKRPPGTPLRTALAEIPRPTAHHIRLDLAAATAAFLYDQPNVAPRPMIDEALWRSVEPPTVQCSLDTGAYLKTNPDLVNYVTPEALAGHWRAFGLREQRLAPGTNLFGERRLHLEHLGLWQTGGVNLFGAFSAPSGLGAAVRGYRDAMIAAGIIVDEYDVSGHSRRAVSISTPNSPPHRHPPTPPTGATSRCFSIARAPPG